MPSPLSGPGVGLPLPQNLYPSELYNTPYDNSNSYITLAPGQAIPVPAGNWWVASGDLGLYQYLDPITQIWRGFSSARDQPKRIKSDGFNFRIANLTGCPVASVVTGHGSAYVQASTTVVPVTGTSTWSPIVGGMVSVVSVGTTGANYGVAPMVFVPAPPPGGVPATAYATISAGTVSGVTLSNVGGGYTSAPVATILPNPTDPNIASGITQATCTLALVGAGSLVAALCTNNGAPLASFTNVSMTVAGVGTAATVNMVIMQTLTGASISAGGFGYGANTFLSTFGGVPGLTDAFTNPAIDLTSYVPRPAQVSITTTAGSITAVGTIYDGGLFVGTPLALLSTLGSPASTAANLSLTMGTGNATVLLQPAP